LEITPTFEDLLRMQMPEGATLRGVIFKVNKTAGGAKGRFVVEVMGARCEEANMQMERDPMPILKYLWARNSGTSQKKEEAL
jgi:hypothetical protein